MSVQLLSFLDITDSIREALGIQASDTSAVNKIKRLVNMVYLDEVVPFKRWQWLEKSIQVVHVPYFNVGTCSVTPLSTTVTLGTAPNVSLGSFKNYRFSVDGSNQVYTVAAHVAASTTLTLTSAFQEPLNATASFKIWRDRFDLPNDAKETIEIWHSEFPQPLTAVGSQGFRALEAGNPKAEGVPLRYNTWDFFNPDDPAAEVDADRYRQTRIYPSISTIPVTLNVDYTCNVVELVDDADEPLMPRGDRIVLYYGAAALGWSVLNRNEEMHDKWQAKYQAKLARMAGERDDGFDTPSLTPTSGYVNTIRNAGLKRRQLTLGGLGGGQTSVGLPSYLKNVIIDGGEVRNNLTVDNGILIDGRDISVDGALLDSLANEMTTTLADNTTNGVVGLFPLSAQNVVEIGYSISRSGIIEAGVMTIVAAGSTAAFAQGATAQTGDTGTTFSVDVSGGSIRLLYTTTSTGFGATFTYRNFKWLG